jgi:cold shock CspA family protein
MNRFVKLSTISAFALGVSGLYAAPAAAQATRTWVSGVGDDANPCSRTAPCKTFAGAISKTAAGGEINCLDPGGFGGVTITKALSIVCQYTEGGVLVAGAGVNGIVINAPATSDVYLRGLDIFGAGTAQNGVRFIAGQSLTIEDSTIRSFNASSGRGISFQPSGTSRLFVRNSTINNNGTTSTGSGVLIQPTGASGNARVHFENVMISNNANGAITIDTTGATSGLGVLVEVTNSTLTSGLHGILITTPVGTSFARANIVDSSVTHVASGLSVNGANALIRASGNLITDNGIGMAFAGGGQIFGYGDNVTDGNQNPSTFTAGSPLGKN